jgi:hypothetical protein
MLCWLAVAQGADHHHHHNEVTCEVSVIICTQWCVKKVDCNSTTAGTSPLKPFAAAADRSSPTVCHTLGNPDAALLHTSRRVPIKFESARKAEAKNARKSLCNQKKILCNFEKREMTHTFQLSPSQVSHAGVCRRVCRRVWERLAWLRRSRVP